MTYKTADKNLNGKYLLSDNEYKIMFYIAREYYEKEKAGVLLKNKSYYLEKICEQAIKSAENQIPKDQLYFLKEYISMPASSPVFSEEQLQECLKWRQLFLWHIYENLKRYDGYEHEVSVNIYSKEKKNKWYNQLQQAEMIKNLMLADEDFMNLVLGVMELPPNVQLDLEKLVKSFNDMCND